MKKMLGFCLLALAVSSIYVESADAACRSRSRGGFLSRIFGGRFRGSGGCGG